jgi:rod shape-determining protein MreD
VGMNRKVRLGIFVVLVLLQIVVQKYMDILKVSLDLLYLVLVYISVKSGFFKTVFSATAVGLVTDYFSMQVMGVFGFSRTIIAFLLNDTSRHIDLKNRLLVFLLISLSLSISNALSNVFFYFIRGVPFNLNLILYQPLLTGLAGVLILSIPKVRRYLDVY